MEISRYLRQHSRTIAGKSQLFINSYAKALEVYVITIPRKIICLVGGQKKPLLLTSFSASALSFSTLLSLVLKFKLSTIFVIVLVNWQVKHTYLGQVV